MSKATSPQRALKNLQQCLNDLERVPAEELIKIGERIKEKAIAQAPYSTGKLERSIEVEVTTTPGKYSIKASASSLNDVGYDYAGIQHENTEYQHPVKGKAHYIRDPFYQETRNLRRRLRRRLKIPK